LKVTMDNGGTPGGQVWIGNLIVCRVLSSTASTSFSPKSDTSITFPVPVGTGKGLEVRLYQDTNGLRQMSTFTASALLNYADPTITTARGCSEVLVDGTANW
jgi:hypothetical protein